MQKLHEGTKRAREMGREEGREQEDEEGRMKARRGRRGQAAGEPAGAVYHGRTGMGTASGLAAVKSGQRRNQTRPWEQGGQIQGRLR